MACSGTALALEYGARVQAIGCATVSLFCLNAYVIFTYIGYFVFTNEVPENLIVAKEK
jgi:hypothetical protein